MGDDITNCENDRSIVIVNHQSTGDVPVMMHALFVKGTVLRNIMWIMDGFFKYTNFGWVSLWHCDAFIYQVKIMLYRLIANIIQMTLLTFLIACAKFL